MDRAIKFKKAAKRAATAAAELLNPRRHDSAGENVAVVCEVARDLIPLYADGAASGRTRSFLESHLRVCSDCASYYRMVKAAPRKKLAAERAGRLGVGGFADVAGRIRRRRAVWASLAALALAVSLGINLFILLSRGMDK